jgi:hypothetical protein
MLRSLLRPALAALALFPLSTHAQECTLTGAFQPLSPHFITSSNTPGYSIQGNTIFIDGDADGTASASDPADHSHPVPAELLGGDGPLNVRLSPSREFLFSAGGTSSLISGNCTEAGKRVRIYSVPLVSGQPLQLVVDDCLSCQGLDGGTPLWYDQGITTGGAGGQPPTPNSTPISSLRYAYIRTNTSAASCGLPSAIPELRFYDLTNGDTDIVTLGLQPGAGVSRVSPGGEFLLFQHDLTNVPTDSDVIMLRMCDISAVSPISGSPPSLNDVSIPGINAIVTASTASGATMVIRNSSQQTVWTATAACCNTGGELGACCTGNTCSVTLQADCTGTWTGGVACAQSGCGSSAPVLTASITAPTNMQAASTGTIRVRITNTGGAATGNVQVRLQSPSQSFFTFASPSPAGTLGFGNASITWNTTPLAAGATRDFTATLISGCFTGTQTFTATATSPTLSTANASRATTITPVPSFPVNVTINSVPSTSPPLTDGDTITHSITLTNTSSNAQSGLSFGPQGLSAGANATFISIDACPAGTCQIPTPNSFSWNGGLAGNQTVTFIVTSRIGPCYNPTFPRTALANGGQLSVIGPCNTVPGSSPPQPFFDLRPSVYAVIEATNLQPNIIGNADVSRAPVLGTVTQLVRDNPDLSIRVTIVNPLPSPTTLDNVTLNTSAFNITSLPTGGAIFDSNSNLVTFTGSLPGSSSVSFTFGATALNGDITNQLTAQRQSATCTSAIGTLALIPMVDPPAGAYVLSVNTFFGASLALLERGVDTRLEAFLGPDDEWNAITKGDNNDAWLAGRSLTQFNFANLTYQTYPQVFSCFPVSPTFQISAVTFDAGTADLLLYGQNSGDSTGTLVRFTPSTGACATIATDIPAPIRPQTDVRIRIEPTTGDILVSNHDVLLRFSAGSPLPPATRTSVSIPGPTYNIPDSGPMTNQRIWAATPLCTGDWAVIHATEFMTPLQGSPARIFAVSTWNPSTNITTTVDPLFAGEGFNPCCGWNVGQPVAPVFTVTHRYPREFVTATFIEGEPGELMFGTNSYPAFAIGTIDVTTGALTYLQDPAGFQFTSARDLAYFNPASTTCGTTPCPADFNQDGGVDGQDVQDFFDAWSNATPTADVNQDGGIDGQDVQDFFTAWVNGGC